MSSHIHTHILAYSEVGRKRLQTTIYGTLAGKRGQILTHFSAYIPFLLIVEETRRPYNVQQRTGRIDLGPPCGGDIPRHFYI